MSPRLSCPHARLAAALRLAPLSAEEIATLQDMPGLAAARRVIPAARAGRPVNADAYLSLCRVKGWDPLTCRAADKGMPPWRGAIVWPHLALTLRHEADVLGKGVRPCAKRAGVSASTWWRVSSGQPVSVANLVRLCAYFDRHPHEVTAPEIPARAPARPNVPRETSTETGAGGAPC
ncbi:hypothetical protein [Xanthobacter flavus]|uniref:hypothetical protein n=1 Tax=Xanthobacter flavus TaxID=281 RepID=UPI00372C79B8